MGAFPTPGITLGILGPHYSMLCRSLPAECSSHLRTEQKIKYRARKNRSCCPRPEIAEDGVHHAPRGLGCDQGGCHAPSPEPTKEPASTGNHQNCAEHQEADARGTPEGCEPVVGLCVRRPQTIEKGAAPNQCRSGKR